MLETAALLALCVQVADLSALYISIGPSDDAVVAMMDESRARWAGQLQSELADNGAYVAAMHDGFIAAMQLDGEAFWNQWTACQAELDGASVPGRKG